MIICTHCGWHNADDQAEFCQYCGRYLEWSGERIVPPEEPAESEPADDDEAHRRFIQRMVDWVREPHHVTGRHAAEGVNGGATTALPIEGLEAGADGDTGDLAAPALYGPPAPVAEEPEAPAAEVGSPNLLALVAKPRVFVPDPDATDEPAAPKDVVPPPPPHPDLADPAATLDPAAAGETVVLPGLSATVPPDDPATAMGATAAATAAPPVQPVVVPAPESIPVTAVSAAPAVLPHGIEDLQTPAPGAASGPLTAAGAGATGLASDGRADAGSALAVTGVMTALGATAAATAATAARRPGEAPATPARRLRPPPPPDRAARPGDVICPVCGLPNDPVVHHFCERCGTAVVIPVAPPPPIGFWRRVWLWLTRPFRRHRKVALAGTRPGWRWRRAGSAAAKEEVADSGDAKDAADGAPAKPKKKRKSFKLTNLTLPKLTRVIPIAVAVLALLAVYGPRTYRDDIRHTYERVKNYIEKQVDIQYLPINPVITQASSFFPADPPGNATDGDTATYWSTGDGKGVGQTLTLDFSQSESIQGFSILSGDQAGGSKTFPLTAKPAKIKLIFSSGPSFTFTLKNSAAFQDFRFLHPSTRFLTIKILTVYPGKNPFCAITEATAYVRS